MATSRWLIVAGQQVNCNQRLLVNAPAVRLIATGRWLIVARQQVNRNRGLLVKVAETWLMAAELLVNGDRSPVNVPMARLM